MRDADRALPLRGWQVALSLLLWWALPACTMASGVPDRPILLSAAAPPTRVADIAIYEGRPSRPYEALALVRACAFFDYSEKALREQAASIGADAIAERHGNNESELCLSGVAVRFLK